MPIAAEDERLIKNNLLGPFEQFTATPQFHEWHGQHLSRIRKVKDALDQAPMMKSKFRELLESLYSPRYSAIDKILDKNSADAIERSVQSARNPTRSIGSAYTNLSMLHGIGTSIATEIMHRRYPDRCAFLSVQVRKVLGCYPWSKAMKAYTNPKLIGSEYTRLCDLIGGAELPSVRSVLARSAIVVRFLNGIADYEVTDIFFRFWSLSWEQVNDVRLQVVKRQVDNRFGVEKCLSDFQ